MYGYFGPGPDFIALLPIAGIYPAITVIFLNYFPFKKSEMKKALYIFGWTVFALVFEWSTVKAGWFYYKSWKLWYSALLYPILYLLLVGNFKMIRRWSRNKQC